MAGREKISSIYISNAEKEEMAALNDFRQSKKDGQHSLSHSDLYKAGLGLFSANPSLIKSCKMLSTLDLNSSEELLSYLALTLKTSIGPEPTNIEPLIKLIQEQSARIEELTALVQKQSEIVSTLSVRQLEDKNESSTSTGVVGQQAPAGSVSHNEDGSLKMEEVVEEEVPLNRRKKKIPPGMIS
jgi:hypothetical protein